MRCRRKLLAYLAALSFLALSVQSVVSAKQQIPTAASDAAFDPLRQVATVFPDRIKLNETKRTLEFCPDYDTCDGFEASAATSVATMKDAAYLYIYFFSTYNDLTKWRNQTESRTTAQRVLSKAEYRNCKRDTDVDTARCVLLGLGRKDAIRLQFIRYDEGSRNVVREDLVKELTATASQAGGNNRQKYSESLLVAPSGKNSNYLSYPDGRQQVTYTAEIPYPAESVLTFLKAELQKRGWKPLPENYFNPGTPSSIQRGWGFVEDHTRQPWTGGYGWGAEWENSAHDLTEYSLRYDAPDNSTRNLRNLQVIALFIPAEIAAKMKHSVEPKNQVRPDKSR